MIPGDQKNHFEKCRLNSHVRRLLFQRSLFSCEMAHEMSEQKRNCQNLNFNEVAPFVIFACADTLSFAALLSRKCVPFSIEGTLFLGQDE